MTHADLAERAVDRRTLRPPRPRDRGSLRPLALVATIYVLGALTVLGGLWTNLDGGYLHFSGQDQYQWEWFFAVTAKNLVNGDNLLFSMLQNYPHGVNLMANTVMLAVGIPLAPVTLLLGPTVTWTIVLTAGLAGTATAWYWLISKHFASSRVAPAIGGGFCGFAPPVISHANAHPNFVVLFVLPFIVHWLMRLFGTRRPVRDGAILGLLLAAQVFLGEEALLLAVTGLGIAAVALGIIHRRTPASSLRPVLIGLSTAAGVAVAITAYPLFWQFFGPQSYRSLLHGPTGNDVTALLEFASQSLAGHHEIAAGLSVNRTEENAFFGWPLVTLTGTVAWWLWRMTVVRVVTVVAAGAALLSLGGQVVIGGWHTGIPGPWSLVSTLPLYESVLESRLALVCVPAMAILLAVATDAVVTAAETDRVGHLGAAPRRSPLRVLWFGALAAALVPLLPTPLVTVERPSTPAFFTTDQWREYVDDGSMIVVPLPDPRDARALWWQIEADLDFPLPEGYFVGPYGPDRDGIYGAVRRPTSALLEDVSNSGSVPPLTAAVGRSMRADLRFWRADAVVLPPHPRGEALLSALTALLGPGSRVGGVWVWDVRDL